MTVRYIVIENYKEKDIANNRVSDSSGIIPIKGDEIIMSNKDDNYKEKYYKVIKRSIEIIYSENKFEAQDVPFEIKIYLKEIRK